MTKLFWSVLGIWSIAIMTSNGEPTGQRAERDRMVKEQRWREVVDHYRAHLLAVDDEKSGDDLWQVNQCWQRLGQWKEFDETVEAAVAKHAANPALLRVAAGLFEAVPHHGTRAGGVFERGAGGRRMPWMVRGRDDGNAAAGEWLDIGDRDRVRALQLWRQALEHEKEPKARANLWVELAEALQRNAAGAQAWKLQLKTDLGSLPELGAVAAEGGTEGAPVKADGTVVTYAEPASWDAAESDGARLRFALAQAVRDDPGLRGNVAWRRAMFSRSQFDVGTLAGFGWWRSLDPESAKGLLEVDTLADDECLAKTSDGVKRFKLGPEHHFIALLREAVDGGHEQAGDILVEVYLDRRQRDRAAEALRDVIKRFGPGQHGRRDKLLKQITGNWGEFRPTQTFAAGSPVELPFAFRNAKEVETTAQLIDMDRVVRDLREWLKAGPKELDWQKMNPGQIGWRIVRKNERNYLDRALPAKTTVLDPREKHRDAVAELEPGIKQGGAWWVTAKLGDGNSVHTVAWVADMVLLRRETPGGMMWWVADAVGGAPVTGCKLEFLGYRVVQRKQRGGNGQRFDVLTRELERVTDGDGRVLLKRGEWDPEYQWLVVARKEGKASAFHGFDGFGPGEWNEQSGKDVRGYAISDRPLYRAGDTVKLKFWLREVAYDLGTGTRFAKVPCHVDIADPTGESVAKFEKLKLDRWGGVEVEFKIPKDARLGQWGFALDGDNLPGAQGGFRVEEYRKPEFEVKVDAPEKPVRLGETFTATVRANYFHGAPVTRATVRVKVNRASVSEPWFPVWRWDWLYGPGAWWPMADAAWHPGWREWGCVPPPPPWWGGDRWTPEELVLEKTMEIGPDGTAKIEVDTGLAKQIHGDMDARYTVSAEVVDASRRAERGSGSVVAARKPFEVVVWMNGGHARPGDALQVRFSAATIDGRPVTAKGKARLFRLGDGPDGRVTETETGAWDVATDAQGEGQLRIEAPAEGQYRIEIKLAAEGGGEVAGASVFAVFGEAKPDGGYRFGPLEVLADKLEYKPGESARLRLNSDRKDAHVWLFLRVEDGVGKDVRRVGLTGGTAEVDMPLALGDMPNVFVDAVTVIGARVHTAERQLLLPPESRMLEVDLTPAKQRVKPREESKLVLTVKDAAGKPFHGTAVVTVYDKALEAITGGSNVPPIKESFWSWRRNYWRAQVGNSLQWCPGTLVPEGVEMMQRLGRFGDEEQRRRGRSSNRDGFDGDSGGGGGIGGMAFGGAVPEGAVLMDAAPATAAPMAMMAKAAPPAPAGGAAAGGEGPAVTVRTDFADAIHWSGALETDADGRAVVPVQFPDNLTTWKAKVWVLGEGTRVGEGSAEVVTSKDLLVRLQAPRFLVAGDEAVLSAVVHNDHPAAKPIKVRIELGPNLELRGGEAAQAVEIGARGEARVDWRVAAKHEGEAVVRMFAEAADDGDAVERKFPVHVHGMLRQDAWSRVIEPGKESTTVEVAVPDKRRPETTKLTVRFSPSVAMAVVDAIPYLAEYPYGCTEQTLNRFVPAVIARKMLVDLGVDLAAVRAKQVNLNAQELGDPAKRAERWKQWERHPVFDEVEITQMVEEGLRKLGEMQNGDGGWGWFSGWGENSYPHTTAVVVHGLLAAKAADTEVPKEMLQRGVNWLAAYERREVDRIAHWEKRERDTKHHADATDALVRAVLGEAGGAGQEMTRFLVRDRGELPIYAQCLLGLELHRVKDNKNRDAVITTVLQFLKRDPENQTAFLELGNQGYWWCWYGSEVEAHAWFLKLLSAARPQAAETRELAKYLVNNRARGSWWNSTRDTAYAVEALAGFAKASGENDPAAEVEVWVDGSKRHAVKITKEELFTFDGTLEIKGAELGAGVHRVEVKRQGKGPLYVSTYLEVFTLEDHLRAAGLEVKVARRVSKLTPERPDQAVPDQTGLLTTQRAEHWKKELLEDGAKLKSGDLIEVELVIDSKNDYEYLLFEDWKAAGFEPLEALSGYVPGMGGVYMEPRDEKVAFFLREMPRGTHSIRYRLRAEAPGIYHALPARGEGMYAPELRGNSEEIRLGVTD